MKYILAYLLIASSLALTCCGQGDKKTSKDPVAKDPVTIRPVPVKPIGWVSDFDMLFTTEQVQTLDSIIGAHEKETTNQIAIVSYQPDSLQIEQAGSFEKFALKLFNQWGVGTKEKNNGVGILISTNLRKVRIETGPGLVSKLTDEEAQKIIDSIMTPEFKRGDYYTGTLKGLEAIIAEIK